MKIGFIGLGIMGSRMAAHLQRQGYELVVFNRTPGKAASLVNQGALWADTPAAVAEQVDVLFTMLAHPEAVEKTALGNGGFLAALQPGTLWVDCSTVNPSFSRRMAEEARLRQVRFLDAPVAGSKRQADQAELVFLVGGHAADVQTCQPLFETMGSRIVHVEGHGLGTSLKLVLNLLLATSMAAFAEGMVLGQALGISQELLFKVLLGGPVVAPFVAMKREKLEHGNYEAEFPLKWMQKDLQMGAIAAYGVGVAMPFGNVVKEVYSLAIRKGLGQKDFSAIYSFLEEGTGNE
jgi:3-hydroxyisobutyrate dehydrogenase-like beta-hydroxyacid dehydrogenase